MNATKQDLLDMFTSSELTYQQKLFAIANTAERYFDARSEESLGLTDKEYSFIENDMICDLNEGNMPYRPRYIVPDYTPLFEKGCKFLELEVPQDLDEALDSLLILYSHVPSVTSFPVFIGYLDRLLNPFLTGDDASDQKKIKRFLNHIDKTITDSFCHANLGPETNKATELILNAVLELDNPTPNMSFMYKKGVSDEDIYTLAIKANLMKSKPSIANDVYYQGENDRYAIVSCYNCLPEQGGAYTLTRIRLGSVARACSSKEEFFSLLDEVVTANLGILDKKVNFIVNKSNFFKTSFLQSEGFISKDRFTGMLGIVGLYEAVNHLLNADTQESKFGFNKEADALAHEILTYLETRVNNHDAKYCLNNKYLLHAQVGASLSDEDFLNTPAHRLKVGQEPMLYDHIKQIAPFHKYFPSGVGDLFAFDQTWSSKPEAIKPIIDGAFTHGMRYITCYQENTDLIRVTGYLVKKSEVNKLDEGSVVLRDTEAFGKGTNECADVFSRKVRF